MESIWSQTALPRFSGLQGEIQTDVLIIGGGMAGILCAYLLQEAGVDCVVTEANRIGWGITKNTTAKITSQHGLIYYKMMKKLGPELTGMYLQANEQALDTFRQMCQTIDCDFSSQNHYIYSLNDRDALENELVALHQIRYPVGFAEALPLPFPTVGAVQFPRQAQFHPLKFLAAIVPELHIYENTRVTELGKGIALTESGTIHAKKIIVATHFPFLNKHGSFFLKMYQQRSYVLSLENTPKPEGMYLDGEKNGLSFRSYGESLLLGGGGHRTGKSGSGWTALEAFAHKHYPGVKITHRWATQDCMTLDGIPYIGQYSRSTPNLFVATGFNKWGMSSSMVSARLLTDLILEKDNPYAVLFSPSRSMLHPQLGLNILESTKNLLSLSPKRCPHLGCALKWNKQEHSWDCPCHGSRFEEDGTLIDNPAAGNLKRSP